MRITPPLPCTTLDTGTMNAHRTGVTDQPAQHPHHTHHHRSQSHQPPPQHSKSSNSHKNGQRPAPKIKHNQQKTARAGTNGNRSWGRGREVSEDLARLTYTHRAKNGSSRLIVKQICTVPYRPALKKIRPVASRPVERTNIYRPVPS